MHIKNVYLYNAKSVQKLVSGLCNGGGRGAGGGSLSRYITTMSVQSCTSVWHVSYTSLGWVLLRSGTEDTVALVFSN
jgi:hypothetical protein